MRKAESYIGGHTLISLTPKQYDTALETQAIEERTNRAACQSAFDQARDAFLRAVAGKLQAAEIDTLDQLIFRHFEALIGDLRRKGATYRTRLRRASDGKSIPDHLRPMIRALREENAATRNKLRDAQAEIDRLKLTANKE